MDATAVGGSAHPQIPVCVCVDAAALSVVSHPHISLCVDATAGGDASGGAAEDHAGVRVRLLHLKDDLSVTEISPASLHGVGAPELAAGAVAALEGGASFASLE
eukprot:1142544-Pelagomonas_calceolata.AAC.1